jgi:hypothetical protein
MVLGGEPQTAYHAGLLATLSAGLLRPRRLMSWGRFPSCRANVGLQVDRWETCPTVSWRGWATSRFGLLAAAAVTAGLLAAIQLLPATEWLGQSERAAYRAPRSLYEIPTVLGREEIDERRSVALGLFGQPEAGTHHEHIYHFSIGPWRLAEAIWPNFSGRWLPTNRRWTNAIPAEGQVWSPSLYQGLLPLLLALGAWSLRRGPARVRWLSWSALLATLGSFGWYGVGWLIHEFRYTWWGAAAADVLVGHPVGGVYWCLVVLLPGYAHFRYPAKLLTVAALALSLLAARGFDRWGLVGCGQPRAGNSFSGWQRAMIVVAGLSLAGWLGTWLLAARWETWLHAAPGDAWLGPLDVAGSLGDLRRSLLHTALLGGLLLGLSLGRGRAGRVVPMLGLLLTAVDLAVANGWMVVTAPQAEWQRPAYCAERIAQREESAGDGQPFRVFRGTRSDWLPREWSTSSADRAEASLRWDRATLFPKHHLDAGLALLEADGTLASHDFRTVLRIARWYGPKRSADIAEPHPLVLNALAAKYLILPDGFVVPGTQRLASIEPAPANAAVWTNLRSYPRAWIVHRAERLAPLTALNPAATEQRTRQILFPGGRPRDLRRTAVVEMAELLPASNVAGAESTHSQRASDDESCRILVDEPQRVEIEAVLAEPGWVVLSDLYYPGWTATVVTEGQPGARRVPVVRTDRVLRGLFLPAGHHRLVYTYRPTRFYVGAAVSAVAWLALVIAGGAGWWRCQTHRG